MRIRAMYRATAATAVIAAAGAGALVFASQAAAAKTDTFMAVDCPQPFAETCPTQRSVTVDTPGGMFWEFHATDSRACGPITVHTFLDGAPYGQAVVSPGGRDGGYFENISGRHTISVMLDAVGSRGGCNQGIVSGWAGNLHVETGADSSDGAT